jgi:dihydropyrimidinase
MGKNKTYNCLLISGGMIYTSDRSFTGNILIRDGRIEEVAEQFEIPYKCQVIDAEGMMIFPGGIDPHVHLELPTPAGNSGDDFYSGSAAAISGGTTSIIDFVTPARGESLTDAFKKREKAAQKSLIGYSFHVSPTWWGSESAREMEILVKEHGVTSFKCYLAYQKSIGIKDRELLEVMKAAKKIGVLVTLHCEMDDIIQLNIQRYLSQGNVSPKYHALSRPPVAEVLAVKKAIDFAAVTGCKIYIVHVSTAGAVDLIRSARHAGMEVYGETCPQYLLLDESLYGQNFEKSAPYVISPPLRRKEDQEALWEGIADGSIQTVGTDHCPFNLKGQKDLGRDDFTKIPNGAGGIEHRLTLLHTYGVLTKRISFGRFIEVTSKNPASIFGLKTKSSIRPGMDADLVIWDANRESEISVKTHFQNCDSEIYDGLRITGCPSIVISKGRIAFRDHEIILQTG